MVIFISRCWENLLFACIARCAVTYGLFSFAPSLFVYLFKKNCRFGAKHSIYFFFFFLLLIFLRLYSIFNLEKR